MILFILNWIISPTDLNHIVLINHSGTNFKNLTVNLDRSDKSRHVIYNGAGPKNLVHVVNWPNAFYGDSVEVSEAGATLGRVSVGSRGRYGHSLIILIGPDSQVLAAHDCWPAEEAQAE
jgi:hypothetical protein